MPLAFTSQFPDVSLLLNKLAHALCLILPLHLLLSACYQTLTLESELVLQLATLSNAALLPTSATQKTSLLPTSTSPILLEE